jgi:hypothetical protein
MSSRRQHHAAASLLVATAGAGQHMRASIYMDAWHSLILAPAPETVVTGLYLPIEPQGTGLHNYTYTHSRTYGYMTSAVSKQACVD